MANNELVLDEVFAALSDHTRRRVVASLGRGPASVSDLANGAGMTLPSFVKHIGVLERCGLIRTAKSGRVRTCSLDRARLRVVDGWLAEQRAVWEEQTDRLERFVTEAGGRS